MTDSYPDVLVRDYALPDPIKPVDDKDTGNGHGPTTSTSQQQGLVAIIPPSSWSLQQSIKRRSVQSTSQPPISTNYTISISAAKAKVFTNKHACHMTVTRHPNCTSSGPTKGDTLATYDLDPQEAQITLPSPATNGKRLSSLPQSGITIMHAKNNTYPTYFPDETPLEWRQMGPSPTVMELVELLGQGGPKRVAAWVYTSELVQQYDPATGKRIEIRKNEIGELHVVREKGGVEGYREWVLVSLVGVVEMKRRRY